MLQSSTGALNSPYLLSPQTHHVALLSKLDVDNHIKLEINEEDIESLSIRKDATYPEIKDYVLKKYGFKVSIFYIVQVKRQFDLIECDNFNKSSKEEGDQHVPTCPPEKEETIKDALAWFEMI
ncbi:RNA methyltransferase [Streptococcus timonensis]|jgi:trmA family RNA methyltransferase|uniref:RNA methyltransferase n=1 Tax=Streptococcus timonensis TaxID=1852387 RepID=UPI0039C4BE39